MAKKSGMDGWAGAGSGGAGKNNKKKGKGAPSASTRDAYPGMGQGPSGKLTAQDRAWIKKNRGKLRDARNEGRDVVTSQMETIRNAEVRALAQNTRRFDKESKKIVRNMDRLADNQKLFSQRMKEGARVTQESLGNAQSAGGAVGTAGDMAIVGRRRGAIAAQGRAGETITQGALQQGRATRQAGQGAQRGMAKAGAGAARSAMTVVDVLHAERASEDQRFLTEMRFGMRQMRQEQAFQWKMQEAQNAFTWEMNEDDQEHAGEMLSLQAETNLWYQKKLNEMPMSKAARQELKMQMKAAEAENLMALGKTAPALTVALDSATDYAANATTLYNSDPDAYSGDGGLQLLADDLVAHGIEPSESMVNPETGVSSMATSILSDIVTNNGVLKGEEIATAVVQSDPTGQWNQIYSKRPQMVQSAIDESAAVAFGTAAVDLEPVQKPNLAASQFTDSVATTLGPAAEVGLEAADVVMSKLFGTDDPGGFDPTGVKTYQERMQEYYASRDSSTVLQNYYIGFGASPYG